MADNTENTGANNPGVNRNQTKQIISDIKDIKKEEGDFNDILKESINLLKKIDRSYEDIFARVKSLDKSQINIRQISNELYKARQKELISVNRLAEAESKLGFDSDNRIKQYLESQNKIAELENRKYQYERNALKAINDEEKQAFLDKAANVEFIIDSETARNLRLKDGLSIQEAEVIALRQATDISKEGVEFGKQQLEIEKQTAKQLGISGNLLKGFATKLGVGEEAYEAMTEKARELVEQNGKVGGFGSKLKVLQAGLKAGATSIKDSFSDPVAKGALVVAAYKGMEAGLTKVGDAAASAGNFLAGMSEDSSDIVRGLTSDLSSMARNIPLVGGLLGGLIDGFSAILDLVIGVDDKIIKAGRQLNLSAQEARTLNRYYQDIAFQSGDIFLTSKKMLETQVKIADQLGVTNLVTNEILASNIKLQEIADLEEETQKGITESSIINEQAVSSTVKSVLAQVEGLKKATGIQFQNQKILKEATSLGGYLGLQFAKYPASLTKSLVTVKAMGLELKQLDSIADSFLDFESSISKEFEAQLLTGKDINLAKAREAFLNNDLATAAAEITSQVGSAADFLKLNRIQAESLAGAFGMSRDQLGEILKQQELLSKLGAKQGDNAREQLRLGLEKYKNQKALNEAIGEEAYQNLVTASTQEKIAAFMDKIKQTIVDFVERTGLIEKIEGFIDKISDPAYVNALLKKVQGFFADAVEFIGEAAYHIVNALDYVAFGQIPNDFIDSLRSGSKNIADQIRSVGMEFKKSAKLDLESKSQNKNIESNIKAQEESMSMKATPRSKSIEKEEASKTKEPAASVKQVEQEQSTKTKEPAASVKQVEQEQSTKTKEPVTSVKEAEKEEASKTKQSTASIKNTESTQYTLASTSFDPLIKSINDIKSSIPAKEPATSIKNTENTRYTLASTSFDPLVKSIDDLKSSIISKESTASIKQVEKEQSIKPKEPATSIKDTESARYTLASTSFDPLIRSIDDIKSSIKPINTDNVIKSIDDRVEKAKFASIKNSIPTESIGEKKAENEVKVMQQFQIQNSMAIAKPTIQNNLIYEDNSYFDANNGKWIRSGVLKTVNQDIQSGQMGQPA